MSHTFRTKNRNCKCKSGQALTAYCSIKAHNHNAIVGIEKEQALTAYYSWKIEKAAETTQVTILNPTEDKSHSSLTKGCITVDNRLFAAQSLGDNSQGENVRQGWGWDCLQQNEQQHGYCIHKYGW